MPEDEPVPPEYDIQERDAADRKPFGIDPSVNAGLFSDLVDEAAIHAADAARRDARATDLPWITLGPRNVGGRIRCMAQDPLEPRTIYAGSGFGGLWKTVDGGDTWRPLNSFLEPDADPARDKDVALPVGAIGICHRSPQTLYVGTGEPVVSKFSGTGLYRSTDGGATFDRIDTVDGGGVIGALRYERIQVDPWNAGRCWIACPEGLWRREPAAPAPHLVQDVVDDPDAPPTQNVTDVVIDFGNRTAGAPPGRFTVYVGMRAHRENPSPAHADFANILPGGVFRAEFDTANARYVTQANGRVWTALTDPAFPFPIMDPALDYSSGGPVGRVNFRLALYGRVKLALCEHRPEHLCMVAGLADHTASRVFRSSDGGDSWRQTAVRATDDGAQAYYDLILAMHPDDPTIFFTGSLDVFRSVDDGESWDKVLNWLNYDRGDRAQHADQHDFFFDRRDARRVWVSNDGGISESRDLGLTWRKRSHGILATQFYDVTTHQTFPNVLGGGLQDNGSWITYGGTSWLHVGGGDGGGLAFQAGQTDVLITNWQGPSSNAASVTGTDRVQAVLTHLPSLRPTLSGFSSRLNWLADQPTRTGASGETLYPYASMNSTDLNTGFTAGHHAIFGGKFEAHPVQPDVFLAARRNAAYGVGSGTISADPPTISFAQLMTGAFSATPSEVTALAFAPTLPPTLPSPNSDNIWWVGTDAGDLFFTTNGGGAWQNASATLPGSAQITDIRVHPVDPNIVVVTTAGRTNNVFISVDAQSLDGTGAPNATWRAISHASGAARDLPLAPVTRAVLDPRDPANPNSFAPTGAGDLQTLYVATLAGVYVCRNATADTGVAPEWFTLNEGMPLVYVTDLDYAESYAADGTTVARRVLRAGTFGRGIYECDLGGTPRGRLMVRSTVVEDGHRYFATQALTVDPRLNVPGTGAPALDRTRAIDIRVDPPPYGYFGETLDGVEFDEDLRGGTLVLGDRNFVYVQVHNRGAARLDGVAVHLYFADAPGTPAEAPDLDADFWADFPAEPPEGATWRRAGQAILDGLHAGQPGVARIEWVPPTGLGDHVALLAVVSHPDDDLGAAAATLPTVVHPGNAPETLTVAERRTALMITAARRVVPDIYVRDAVGDSGEPGAVAWGGRSADIVVTQAPEPDPDTAFGSIADRREGDRIRAGETNHVHVRVFNRSAAPQTATVDLFFVPMAAVADPSAWQRIGARQEVADVPPRGHKFSPAFVWAAADIPDPAPGSPVKAHVLVALIGSAEDPAPDPAGIDSLAAFWEFFLAGDRANNACMRALRYEPES